MEAWGFQYKTAAFVWVKKTQKDANFWGMGAYTRANAEVCLLGVSKGFKASEMIRAHNVHQIIEAPIEKHSKKPECAYEMLEDMFPGARKIELFARNTRPGWESWGKEVGGTEDED